MSDELSQEQVRQRIDADVDRIAAIARGMLTRCYEDDIDAPDGSTGASARLETFVIAGIWTWENSDGMECESPCIGSESRKVHVQQGVLYEALNAEEARFVE